MGGACPLGKLCDGVCLSSDPLLPELCLLARIIYSYAVVSRVSGVVSVNAHPFYFSYRYLIAFVGQRVFLWLEQLRSPGFWGFGIVDVRLWSYGVSVYLSLGLILYIILVI